MRSHSPWTLIGLPSSVSSAADLGVGSDLAAAQLKLTASLPPDASAQRVAERFYLDPAAWYARPERVAGLPQLASAVWTARRIRIGYESWKARVTREADPLGLVLKGGAWYLVASVEGAPRTYRASNIRSLVVLDQAFRRPRGFDLSRFWRTWASEFEARMLRERATIRISQAGRELLRDVYPAAWQALEAEHKPSRRKGWVEAQIPFESVAYSSKLLLRLGAGVEVLSPPALRSAVAAEARKTASLYASGRR